MKDILRLLANETNQAVLGLLQTESSYARKIAAILDLKESEVTRRLRQMEAAGLVSSEWSYIGKNVKMYSLEAPEIRICFEAGGMRIETSNDETTHASVVSHVQSRIPPVGRFCGREEELARLAGHRGVSIVAGMAGIGKTALVARYATETDVPVFWHSFRGVESLHWLANRIGVFAARHGDPRLLEAVQQDTEISEQRELLLATVDDPGMAFVFDDVHHVEDLHVQAFIDDAVRRTTQGRLCLTSRTRMHAARGQTHVDEITLAGLADAAVAALLAQDGTEAAADLLERLRPWLGGHPLGLHLLSAAAQQTGTTVGGLLDRAEAGRAGDLHDYLLRELDHGITDSQRRVLTTASIFRTGFTIKDLQAVCSKRIHETDVRELVRQFLILDRGDDYALHSIVRSFFRRMVDDARPMHEKAAKHFLDGGHTEGRIEALHHLIEAGRRENVLKLVGENLDVREYDFIDSGYAQLYLQLLDMFTPAEVGDPARWAVILDEKGDVHFSRGAYEEALGYYEEAAGTFEHDADTSADLAWKRALAHHRLGRPDEAARLVDAAIVAGVPPGRTRERLERLQAELVA